MYKNPWIVFEGGEGSGKSTQSALLAQLLEKRNIPVFYTREPGGCKNSEKIRDILVDQQGEAFDTVSELMLHLAARREHVMKAILPALDREEWVVCDRFNPSTVAYQAFGNGISPNFILQLLSATIGNISPPLVIWFDIDFEKGLARANARKDTNRYEKLGNDFHRRVREGYKYYSKLFSHQVVICKVEDKTPEVIHKEVLNIIRKRFGKDVLKNRYQVSEVEAITELGAISAVEEPLMKE